MNIVTCVIFFFALIAVGTCDNDTCSCGISKLKKTNNNRIVGGVNAIVNEFPLIGGIASSVWPDYVFCGCTIVTKRHAITAAHCDENPKMSKIVLVGEHNLKKETESVTYRIPVEKFISHEEFDANNSTDNDVAVLLLAQELTFGPTVGPACFPGIGATSDLVGKKVRIIGWGRLWYEGPRPKILQKADVSVVPMSFCDAKYNGTTKGQICTYTVDKDSCQGDSGGPVLYMDPETRRYIVVGIVSFGPDDCALLNYPAVSTDVVAYRDWILSKINETDSTSAVCPNK